MKGRKITCWITTVMMALALVPCFAYAEEAAPHVLDVRGGDILVVYESDADCSKALADEVVKPQDGDAPEAVTRMAEECAGSVSEETGAEVTESEFIAGSLGSDGAVLQVTLDEGADVDEAVAALNEAPEVAYAQRNYTYQLFGDEGPAGPEAAEGGSAEAGEPEAAGESPEGAGPNEGAGDVTESGAAKDDDASMSDDAVSGDPAVLGDNAETTAAANDEYLAEQYYLGPWDETFGSDCGANVFEAWTMRKTNGSVSVAVLDSGVQKDHPDLQANLDMKNAASVVSNIYDDYGHGTHVAGIVAAAADNGAGIAGASYNAKIIPIKVVDDFGGIKTSYFIAAYEFLKERIESGKIKNLHVINMSIGGYDIDKDDYIHRKAIKELRSDYDIITVCAGGNGNKVNRAYTDKVYPADFDECLSVTSLGRNGTNSAWSDYNEYKDISAPGEDIYSTYPGSRYETLKGTSMSAPLVSGIMAMLWAENPNLTAGEAVKAVQETAHPVNTSVNDRGAATGSRGAIDAAEALKYVRTKYSGSKSNIRKLKTKAKLSTTLYGYTGKARKPSVSIPGLRQGRDFYLTFGNNVKVGKATVTINGKGNYRGSFTKTYTIRPAATKITSFKRYRKAFRIKWKKKAKQVTGYQIRYSTRSSMKSAVTKKVKGASSVTKKFKGLKAKKLYYVQIRTYKTVSGKTYYSKWSARKKIRTK